MIVLLIRGDKKKDTRMTCWHDPDRPPDDEHDPDEPSGKRKTPITVAEWLVAGATASGVLLQGADLYFRLKGVGS